jgi:hypothetical protein
MNENVIHVINLHHEVYNYLIEQCVTEVKFIKMIERECYKYIRIMLELKNIVFWDPGLCGSCKNRRFGGTYRIHYHYHYHSSKKNHRE